MIKEPTISVNKLAEYIVSRGLRQRAILSQRKYPDPDFNVGMFHRESVEAIQRYVADGALDPGPIDTALSVLNQMAPEKIGTIRRIGSNITRLEQFQEMLAFRFHDGPFKAGWESAIEEMQVRVGIEVTVWEAETEGP